MKPKLAGSSTDCHRSLAWKIGSFPFCIDTIVRSSRKICMNSHAGLPGLCHVADFPEDTPLAAALELWVTPHASSYSRLSAKSPSVPVLWI